MGDTNEMTIEFEGRMCNEGFIRVAVAAFATQLNPTLEEVADIKTAVSEAVTNSIIHGYNYQTDTIRVTCRIQDQDFYVSVMDEGCGIENIQKAMEPLYTTRPEEDRAGMGFAFMEAFMDDVRVESVYGEGCKVHMRKRIGHNNSKYE